MKLRSHFAFFYSRSCGIFWTIPLQVILLSAVFTNCGLWKVCQAFSSPRQSKTALALGSQDHPTLSYSSRCFIDNSSMNDWWLLEQKIVDLNVEEHWKGEWNVYVTSKSHQFLRCLTCSWWSIDVFDDNNNESWMLTMCSQQGEFNYFIIQYCMSISIPSWTLWKEHGFINASLNRKIVLCILILTMGARGTAGTANRSKTVFLSPNGAKLLSLRSLMDLISISI